MRNGTNVGGARWRALALPTLASLGAVGTLGAPPARAAETDPLARVRACIAERDDAQRLACFDRAAAALPADARPPAPAPPPAPAAPVPSPEERFGYRGQVAREELDRRKAEDSALEELSARVTRVGQQGTGDFVVTLDNGQVWAQIPTGRPSRLKVDDAVTIKRASFGSFMLSAPGARGVRVRRVK